MEEGGNEGGGGGGGSGENATDGRRGTRWENECHIRYTICLDWKRKEINRGRDERAGHFPL